MSVLAIPVPTTVGGLPFHPLIVHAVVVILPLAVLGAIGISVWPAMRRSLGLLVLLAGVIGLILVPVATSSGEKFRDMLGAAQLVKTHEHYADHLLPYSAILAVLLLLTMVVDLARRLGPVLAVDPVAPVAPVETAGGGVAVATKPVASTVTSTTRLDRAVGRVIPVGLRSNTGLLRAAQPVLSVLTIVVALILAWYVYKTGDSGAKAVWGGR
jgi:hypothetical protein